MNTNEHEYYFRSDKLFGCNFLASIREYWCSLVAKILSRAGQRPQTTKSVSASKVEYGQLHKMAAAFAFGVRALQIIGEAICHM
jgi:hypothetical protein